MSTQSFIIGVGGGTGAGKTTLITDVSNAIETGTTTISLDNYYRDRSDLPPEKRKELNYDHPKAIEWELFISDLKKSTEESRYNYLSTISIRTRDTQTQSVLSLHPWS